VGIGEVFDRTGGRERKNGKGKARDVFGIWHFWRFLFRDGVSFRAFFEMASIFAVFFTSAPLKCSKKIGNLLCFFKDKVAVQIC
jgi:hypothetical protein